MGYTVKGDGYIAFKDVLDDDKLDEIEKLIENQFEFDYMRAFKDSRTGKTYTIMNVWMYGKYHDDVMLECLEKVGKISELADGEIKFVGEDDCYWHFILRNHEWVEENGHVRYCDEEGKVYVYKAYNDGLAYGDEAIWLFNRKDDAIACLKQGVETAYGMTLEEMQEDPEYENDIVEPERVIITNDEGDTSYFLVEALPIT